MNPTIKRKLSTLPEQSGCYLMKDCQGTIIYVGKAKILKNRVRSYFTGSHDGKTLKLVKQIVDFEYILTLSDLEALILEMNLIKKFTPKYNILLKDDKSYPFIKITSERHPQLIITREIKKDNGKYFGPFPNVQAAKETKKLLDYLYPLRRCPLSSKHACVYYQLGLCIGSCVKEVSKEEYRQVINKITRFFHGGSREVNKALRRKMEEASKCLDFEKAQKLRDQISYLEATMEKQNVTTMDGIDRDIFGYDSQHGWMCIQVFYIRQGKLIERKVSIVPTYDEPESTFLTFLGQFYLVNGNVRPREILIPEKINKDLAKELLQINIIQPKRGKKRQMVGMACKNASVSLQEKLTLMELKCNYRK